MYFCRHSADLRYPISYLIIPCSENLYFKGFCLSPYLQNHYTIFKALLFFLPLWTSLPWSLQHTNSLCLIQANIIAYLLTFWNDQIKFSAKWNFIKIATDFSSTIFLLYVTFELKGISACFLHDFLCLTDYALKKSTFFFGNNALVFFF